MGRIKENYEADEELLYLISENTEEADEAIFKKYDPVINYYSKKYSSIGICEWLFLPKNKIKDRIKI